MGVVTFFNATDTYSCSNPVVTEKKSSQINYYNVQNSKCGPEKAFQNKLSKITKLL